MAGTVAMGVKERRIREKESLREEILAAARDIFVHEGYDGLSMRRVADKIEYSPTAIYLHFKDKSELVFSLCQESFARLNQQMQSLLNDEADPMARLRKGLRTYVDFGLRNPWHYLVAFVVPHDHSDPSEYERYTSAESNGMQAFAVLQGSVEECVQRGLLKRVDANVASRTLWAAVHGITSLLLVHEKFPWGDKQKLIDTVIDSMIDGLKVKA
jgi:AcrR family transcriptional regulator